MLLGADGMAGVDQAHRVAPLLALASAALCSACLSAPPDLPSEPVVGFALTQAGPDCAPWDGAAVTITFSGPSSDLDSIRPPYLRLSLWKGIGDLVGHTWRWPVDEQIGAASFCLSEEDCRAAVAGVVRLELLGADSAISGRLRLEFSDRPEIAGSFRAAWRSRVVMCG